MREKTLTRAITLSVMPHEGIDRDGLWRSLHQSWNAVQRAANMAMRVWLSGDAADTTINGKGKLKLSDLPKELSNHAYHAARSASPELPSGAIADICQRVRSRYLHDRWAVQVAMQKSTPSFGRPLPLSIRKQDWHLITGTDEHGRECYFARFALLDLKAKARPTVRLICRTARDAQLLHQIATGEHERRTLEILPPGWIRKGAIRVKVVYKREPAERKAAKGRYTVRTGADALLVGSAEKQDAIHRWNLDWLKERIVAYERRRHRHAEDCKHERRVPKSRRRVWRQDAGQMAEKHRNRVRTALQQAAAQVVGRAIRSGCSTIEYDDTDRTWIETFPWLQLRESLQMAADNHGLEFVYVAPNNGGCPAEPSGGSPSASTADDKPRSQERKGSPM